MYSYVVKGLSPALSLKMRDIQTFRLELEPFYSFKEIFHVLEENILVFQRSNALPKLKVLDLIVLGRITQKAYKLH